MPNTVKSFTGKDESRIRKERLRIMILDILKVSTIPSVIRKVMEVADDPMTGVRDLEKVIENDPAIASRVVAVSNAVFYGFPRKINSISQAVLVLGFEMVKGLAISTTVFNVKLPGAAKELAAIWGHSFKCAMASVLLARKTGLLTKEAAFLAGLLSDIGKPIMVQACGEGYLEAAKKASLDLEGAEFGANHAEAGAWFADKCKLPEDCVTAIKYHHGPMETLKDGSKCAAIVSVTYLANVMASDIPANDTAGDDIKAALQSLDLTVEDFEEVRTEFSSMNITAPSFA